MPDSDTPSREDMPTMVYVVFDLDCDPVEAFDDEDEAYGFCDHDQTVVTYRKV